MFSISCRGVWRYKALESAAETISSGRSGLATRSFPGSAWERTSWRLRLPLPEEGVAKGVGDVRNPLILLWAVVAHGGFYDTLLRERDRAVGAPVRGVQTRSHSRPDTVSA